MIRFSKPGSLLAALAGIATMLAGSAALADDAPGGRVTYAEHVAPIINSSCVNCHRPGQIGPMSLLEYKDVRPWAKSIKQVVADRTMPPWHADPAYGEFHNERRLTDAQIQTLSAWVDQGAQPGNLELAPKPEIDTSTIWAIGEPDRVFEMAEYAVPDDVEDQYMHFLIPAAYEEDKDIIAMEIRAGAPEMVHHVLVFALPPGMGENSVFEDGGTALRSDFITGWAPGTDPLTYKDTYAKRLKKGHNLLFQVHYHKVPGPGTGAIDKSQLAVRFADELVPNPTMTAWVMNLELAIPPNEANYVSTSQFEFKSDGLILGYTPHMHLRGREATFLAIYPDGTEEKLLYVPNYDFNWQTFYGLKEPKFIPKGTLVKSIQRYDNSADNPFNPDPTQTVYFSEATTDEMHIGFMEYAYTDKSVIAQKFGFPEGFNMYEFQQRERARYSERHAERRAAQEAFEKQQQSSAASAEPATAGGL
jgi:mono/diheme cytochrome c family protein